jgi:hypothetical protein
VATDNPLIYGMRFENIETLRDVESSLPKTGVELSQMFFGCSSWTGVLNREDYFCATSAHEMSEFATKFRKVGLNKETFEKLYKIKRITLRKYDGVIELLKHGMKASNETFDVVDMLETLRLNYKESLLLYKQSQELRKISINVGDKLIEYSPKKVIPNLHDLLVKLVEKLEEAKTMAPFLEQRLKEQEGFIFVNEPKLLKTISKRGGWCSGTSSYLKKAQEGFCEYFYNKAECILAQYNRIDGSLMQAKARQNCATNLAAEKLEVLF